MRDTRRGRTQVVLAALLAATVIAGCGGGRHHSAPTATMNLAVIPPVITPAYVNAVFLQLNHVYGNALRQLVATHDVNADVSADLRAIYDDPQYAHEMNIFSAGLTDLTRVKSPPGDPIITVKSIQEAAATCIETTVSIDGSPVTHSAAAPVTGYVVLDPSLPSNDPRKLNSTAWTMQYEEPVPPPVGTTCANR